MVPPKPLPAPHRSGDLISVLKPLPTTVVSSCLLLQPSLLSVVDTRCLPSSCFVHKTKPCDLACAPAYKLQLPSGSSLLPSTVLFCFSSTQHLNLLKILPIVSVQEAPVRASGPGRCFSVSFAVSTSSTFPFTAKWFS